MIQVRISTQPTRTNVHTSPAGLDHQSRRAQVQITATNAQPDIRQGQGNLSIDSYPCRAARGLLNSADMTRDAAQRGRMAVEEAVAQYVQEGNRLARFSSQGNSVVQLTADRNAALQQPFPITWAAVPSPELNYEMTPTQIEWTPAQVSFQVQPAELQGSYTPGEFDIQVTQYASIEIRTTEADNTVDVQG